jgi:hypothetical protein
VSAPCPASATHGSAPTSSVASTCGSRSPASSSPGAEAASTAYDLERFAGPVPDELLGDLQVLREGINDEPGPGEFAAFPPERLRAQDASRAGRHQTAYTILARHRATGEPAGSTLVCVHELRPRIAAPDDTSVLAPHRGHRLGLRLKLARLDLLRADRPDVEYADTWNVPENAPIIAINEALGCRRVAETMSFRKLR